MVIKRNGITLRVRRNNGEREMKKKEVKGERQKKRSKVKKREGREDGKNEK